MWTCRKARIIYYVFIALLLMPLHPNVYEKGGEIYLDWQKEQLEKELLDAGVFKCYFEVEVIRNRSLSLSIDMNYKDIKLKSVAHYPIQELLLVRGKDNALYPFAGLNIRDAHIRLEGDDINFTPLVGMPIKRLYLVVTSTKRFDLSILRTLPLENLIIYLYEDSVLPVDLSPLNGMALRAFYISNSTVSNLSPLKGMPLDSLGIPYTAVTDLTPLKEMQLTELNLNKTEVTDITPLDGMPLRVLRLCDTKVTSLSPLQGAPLEVLYLARTEIVDLTPLRGMKLTKLDIRGTKIKDLSPLKGMPLKSLLISETEIKDLSPLKGMPLESIEIRGCKNLDLTPLDGMDVKIVKN